MAQNDRYIVLQKGNVTLKVDTVGAQIVSYQVDGVELMYQGAQDPNNHAWKKTAPVLFPNPGPMITEAVFQRRNKKGELKVGNKNKPVYASQNLRSVVVGIDAEGNQKNFYVKQEKDASGKKQLVFVDKNGREQKDIEPTQNDKGEIFITVKGENKTYFVGKKPVVFTEYVHNGGYYYMAQHGFIQSTQFKVMGKGTNNDYCVLGTTSGDDTICQYPYDFNFAAVYSIGSQGALEAKFAANNKGKQTMLGGIGWHPAFKLHDEAGKYKLVLRNVKGAPYREVKGKDGKTQRKYLKKNEELDINELVVKDLKSEKILGLEEADVALIYYPADGAEPIDYLSMHVTSPNLILWSGENNMFAIEPWTTTPRQVGRAKNQHEIETLEDAPLIKPGETKELNATVSINSKYLRIAKELQSLKAKRSR